MPLNSDERFAALLGETTSQLQTWHILDHETRAWTAVEGPSARFGADHEGGSKAGRKDAIDELRKIVDGMLVPKKVTFGESGDPIAISSSAEDDCSPNIYYPPWKRYLLSPDDFGQTLTRSDLREVRRMTSSVDEVEYTRRDLSTRRQIVKYHLMPGEKGVERFWKEVFINRALDGRRYAPVFGKFILDGIRNVLVGFTTRVVYGQSFRQRTGVFLRTWLEQLIDAVDDLNLNMGLIHQDISAANVIVDHNTRQLTIIGYGKAVRSGSPNQADNTNDMKGVCCLLYDVLTQTEPSPLVPLAQRDIHEITGMKSWPIRCALERGLTIDEILETVLRWLSNRGDSKYRSGRVAPLRPRPLHIPRMGYLNGLLPRYCDPQVHLDFHGLPQPARPAYQRDLPPEDYVIRWERPLVPPRISGSVRVPPSTSQTSPASRPSSDRSRLQDGRQPHGRRSRPHRGPRTLPDHMESIPEQ